MPLDHRTHARGPFEKNPNHLTDEPTRQTAVIELGFDADIQTVGLSGRPKGFDGIAGFRVLNRFTYGNFGNPAEFGLEC